MRLLSKRRTIENKTNYAKRMRLLESERPRLVVRKTNKYIILQLIESLSAQDSVAKNVVSSELLEFGWPAEKKGSLKSLPAAYLSGMLLGKKLNEAKIKITNLVIDTGLIRSTSGSRVYAALLGLKDAGIDLKIGEKVVPKKERIENEKVNSFFAKVKANVEKLNAGGKK